MCVQGGVQEGYKVGYGGLCKGGEQGEGVCKGVCKGGSVCV